MAQMTPELRAATDAAKQRIEVESYFPRSMNAGLKGNAQGFWAGTALGAATGALGGGLVSGALLLAGFSAVATTGPGAFIGWPLLLGLAGIGGTMGGATGARIGAGAGSIAGVAAERERRDKGQKLEQEILSSPEKQREVIEAYRKNPVVEKNDTAKEILSTTRHGAFKKFLDWPTFFTAIAICTVASMALFGGAFVLGGSGLLASGAVPSALGAIGMTTMPAALAIGAGTGAAMGTAFGIAYPPIFAGLTKTVADLLSGKFVRGKSNFPATKTIHEMEQEAAQNRILSDGVVTQPNFSALKISDPLMVAPELQSIESPTLQVSDVQAATRLAQAEKHLSA